MSEILKPLEIRPVIEVVSTAEFIDNSAKNQGRPVFRRTPDGWLIPLVCLEPVIGQVVKLIAVDPFDSQDIYLVGGYEFWHHSRYLFGVGPGTSFLYAKEWHCAIQQLENEGRAQVWTSSQVWFNLSLSKPLLEVEQVRLGVIAHPRFTFQFSEYCAQLNAAQEQLQRFAAKFIPAVSQFLNEEVARLLTRDLGLSANDLFEH